MSETNQVIDASLLYKMFHSGANLLANKKTMVDNLNVFPVPDGDTGTNMSMTIASSARFLAKVPEEERTVARLTQEAAHGALMGARGNSGVILSQILRGFSDAWSQVEVLDAKAIVAGFSAGVDAAYKAVANPMEGTILTVVREAAEAAEGALEDHTSPEEIIAHYIKAGYESLERTPELLPVLKQAGVVDAGAQGYLLIVEGMEKALLGEFIELAEEETQEEADPDELFVHFFVDPESIQFQYCTEFLLQSPGNTVSHIDDIRDYLKDMGDCMLVVGTPETTKVHVHTNHPGRVLDHCSQYGELDDIKINNMKSQNRELQAAGHHVEEEVVPDSDYAVIAVTSGAGMKEIFKSTGATGIIPGGQSMNPSTEDFINAIKNAHAKHVILLPNNKNVIMSANQAADMADSDVMVVPTKTMPQGLSALFDFVPDQSLSENVAAMTDAIKNVMSGEITTAVRDTAVDGIEIKEGQFLVIVDGKIIDAQNDLASAVNKIVAYMADADYDLITLYRGENVPLAEADEMLAKLEEAYPLLEFEAHSGNQPVYHFIVSAE